MTNKTYIFMMCNMTFYGRICCTIISTVKMINIFVTNIIILLYVFAVGMFKIYSAIFSYMLLLTIITRLKNLNLYFDSALFRSFSLMIKIFSFQITFLWYIFFTTTHILSSALILMFLFTFLSMLLMYVFSYFKFYNFCTISFYKPF